MLAMLGAGLAFSRAGELVPSLPSVFITDLRVARWMAVHPAGGPPSRFPSYQMSWEGRALSGFGVEGEPELVPSTISVPLRCLPPGAYAVWVGTTVSYGESVPYDRLLVRVQGDDGKGDGSFRRISNYQPKTRRLLPGLIQEDLVGVYKFEIDVPSPRLELRWYRGRQGCLNYVRVTPLLPLEFGWWKTDPALQISSGQKMNSRPAE